MSVVAVYAVVVAALIGGVWAVSLATGGVPEVRTKPWEIGHHLAAEALMAVTLLSGGIAELYGAAAGSPLLALGFGMTLYSIVNSAGYFAQRRQWPPVLLFAILLALTTAASVATISELV
jgi:hypothetical protein